MIDTSIRDMVKRLVAELGEKNNWTYWDFSSDELGRIIFTVGRKGKSNSEIIFDDFDKFADFIDDLTAIS